MTQLRYTDVPLRSCTDMENDPRRWWTLIVLCISLSVIGIDNTILNVALPTLVRDLHASTSALQWIVDVFHDPKERGRAIGFWAAISGLGIALGPIIGGALLDHFWWGSVFLVNAPVVLVALVLGRFLVPESKDPSESKLDPLGALTSIV